MVLILTGLALVPGLADAIGGGPADTPWPMFQHDQRHTGLSPYLGTQKDTLRWTYNTGANIRGSPVIGSDGTIYIANSSWGLFAIDPDGKLKWSYDIGGSYGAPAIGSDGTIYVSAHGGKLYAINPDRSPKWSSPCDADGITASPVIANDGTIYCGANLNVSGGGLYAIRDNGSSGSVKWFYPIPFPGYTYSSPAIGNGGTIYIGTNDTDLYAITDNTTNGVLKWTFNTGASIRSSPAIDDHGTIYVGSEDGYLYAITDNITNAVQKWHYDTFGSVDSSPAIGNDTIYVGCSFGGLSHPYTFYAVNPDGSQKWAYNTSNDIRDSSPAIGSDSTIYIGDVSNRVYAISDNITNGAFKWSYCTADMVVGSPAIGSDGTVYIGSYDKKLYAFSSSPLITSVNPNSGIQGQTLNNVIITGNNFTGATAVIFGADITTDNFTVNSPTQITANITIAGGATPGARAVSVTAAGTGTKSAAFTVGAPQPTVTSVNPNQGNQGQTLNNVTINGTNFVTGQTTVNFSGTGVTASNINMSSATQLTATITIAAGATPGARVVSVTAPGGTGTLPSGFTVLQPTQSVNTATGTGTATFTTSAGSITALTADTSTPCGTLSGFSFPHGFFSITITNISPGSTVTITITLPSDMPANTQYWKCINGQWVNATSILGDNDGDNILTLTITDGSQFDADGQANGTIVDPSAPVVPVPRATVPAAHRVSPTLPNQFKQAQMSLQYLNVNPQQAAANQPVNITTNVVNTGGEAGNLNIALKINGQVEQTKTVSVGPQGAQPVKFIVTRAQPGTYTVDIGGQKGSFTILGAGATAPAPASEGLIAILIVVALIIAVAVLLMLIFRRFAR